MVTPNNVTFNILKYNHFITAVSIKKLEPKSVGWSVYFTAQTKASRLNTFNHHLFLLSTKNPLCSIDLSFRNIPTGLPEVLTIN